MTARLREAFARLRALPEPEQDRAAEKILEEFPGPDGGAGGLDGGTWEGSVAEARRHRANPPPDNNPLAWVDWLRQDRKHVTAGLVEPEEPLSVGPWSQPVPPADPQDIVAQIAYDRDLRAWHLYHGWPDDREGRSDAAAGANG